MKTMTTILVRIPKRFKDTINVNNEELYLETKFDEFAHRVMEGEVVSTPIKYDCPFNKGDTIYFHHHVVVEKSQQIKYDGEDIYQVKYHPTDSINSQAFAYKDQQGNIHPLSNWVLLEPIRPEKKLKSDLLEIVSFDEELATDGVITFLTSEMVENGLRKGDRVRFSKHSDYEIQIEGKPYWRMRISDLELVYG